MDNSEPSSHLGAMPAALISLEDVHLTLTSRAGPVDILRGVDLTVAAGEALGIVGPSGSGKTTLLMVIAGLERVSSGTITVSGMPLSGKNEDALAAFPPRHYRHRLSVLSSDPDHDGARECRRAARIQGAFRCARACREASRARRPRRSASTHYPGQLSGGEQQRVAIARALASGAKIILADEPTGNLDIDTGAAIMDLLFTLKREEGATLLLITHDPALAKRCDRIASVRDGRIVSGAHP